MAAKKKSKPSKKSVKKKAPKKAAAKKKAKAPAKKAAKKAVRKPAPKKKKKARQIVGEGDYAASRTFLKDQAGFVKKNKAKIPGLAKKARAALEGSEGPALLAAEAEARGHSKAGSEE